MHAIWRTRADVRSLRGKRLWRQLRRSLQRCCEKEGFRVVHFAVMASHVHLIVEADDAAWLSRGMQGLGVSMAKRINLVLSRAGAVFEDRYFARRLRTPREVSNAVDYVLHNEERHSERMGRPVQPDAEGAFTSLSPLAVGLTAVPRTWVLLTMVLE